MGMCKWPQCQSRGPHSIDHTRRRRLQYTHALHSFPLHSHANSPQHPLLIEICDPANSVHDGRDSDENLDLGGRGWSVSSVVCLQWNPPHQRPAVTCIARARVSASALRNLGAHEVGHLVVGQCRQLDAGKFGQLVADSRGGHLVADGKVGHLFPDSKVRHLIPHLVADNVEH